MHREPSCGCTGKSVQQSVAGNLLLAVVVVDRDRVDRTGPGGKLGVEFGVFWNLADEHLVVGFFAVDEDRLPFRFVLLESLPLNNTLVHPNTGILVEFHFHTPALERLH